MAVTTQQSTQLALTETEPTDFNPTHEWAGRLRFARFDFTQSGAGDAGSVAELLTLPAGKVRVVLPLSRIAFSALGASRTMDFGWKAYSGDDDVAVAADPNGLDAAVDVSSAGSVIPGGTVGGGETYLFQAKEGVTLTATINGGTFPDAATLNGYVVYVVD